jgi:hypothetical protein
MEGCQIFTTALTSGWLGLILGGVSSGMIFLLFLLSTPVMFMFCNSYDEPMNRRFRSMEHLEYSVVRFGGGYTRSPSAFISLLREASFCVELDWGAYLDWYDTVVITFTYGEARACLID